MKRSYNLGDYLFCSLSGCALTLSFMLAITTGLFIPFGILLILSLIAIIDTLFFKEKTKNNESVPKEE